MKDKPVKATEVLKECPFCGTTEEWFSQQNGFNRCAECGCTCKVEYWNTRAPDTKLVEALNDAYHLIKGADRSECWKDERRRVMAKIEALNATTEGEVC